MIADIGIIWERIWQQHQNGLKYMSNMAALDNIKNSSVDDDLMRKNEDQLRQDKKIARDEQAAKQAEEADSKNKKKDKRSVKNKISDSLLLPVKSGLKWCLRLAWMSVFSVMGFMFGMLYINIHVFFRLIFPKVFCELGEEWIPEQVLKLSKQSGIDSFMPLKIGEKMLFAILEVFFIIFGIIIFLILKYISENRVIMWIAEKLLSIL
jgi:hypothetical protein